MKIALNRDRKEEEKKETADRIQGEKTETIPPAAEETDFTRLILRLSQMKDWENASCEWEILETVRNERGEMKCVTGDSRDEYMFRIRNRVTGNTLYPVCPRCLEMLLCSEVRKEKEACIQLYEIHKAYISGQYIRIESGFFTRNLITYLFRKGVFTANRYNGYSSLATRDYLMEIFNMKKQPTPAQEKKARAIFLSEILPYIRKNFPIETVL